jgi:threonine dehydrogenase-like Zn-dependent dehydrogenase
MKAVVWRGNQHVEVADVRGPNDPRADGRIVRVTATALCGSDLDLHAGLIPGLRPGDVLGHEAFGIVEDVGPT